MKESAMRRYLVADSILFRKTKEEFGGLSNMSAGYTLHVNDVTIPTAEHLYQALRFPEYPNIQWDIINEKSPMAAKWIGRRHIDKTRKDWEMLQFKIMQWVIELKLSQNWESFSSLLKATGEKNIVELTPKPKVWGAVKNGDYCEGVNALGRLLMFIRDKYVKTNNRLYCVSPLDIEQFCFLGYPIGISCDEMDVEQTINMETNRDFVFS